MPSANPVTDAFGYTPTATPTAASSGLGKDTFLKLLVAQMRQQNPMEPTDDKEMIAQMTQFSMLEQITNMATVNADIAAASRMSQAVTLLGRTVDVHGLRWRHADRHGRAGRRRRRRAEPHGRRRHGHLHVAAHTGAMTALLPRGPKEAAISTPGVRISWTGPATPPTKE